MTAVRKIDLLSEVREDYQRFLAEYGMSEEDVRHYVESDLDQVDLPEVFDKLSLGQSLIEGQGMFAKKNIAYGEFLAIARLGDKRTAAGRYTNHSHNPNAKFERAQDGDLAMISTRPILKDEEITVDYRQAGRVNGSGIEPLASDTRRKIELLEEELLQLPQIDFPTKHYYADGVYGREITIPAGSLVTGRIHKRHQINILSKGEISVLTQDGMVRVKAPFTVVSPPGTKRIAISHTECVWTTILPTHLTDPDQIEQEFTVRSDREYLEHLKMLEDKEVTP